MLEKQMKQVDWNQLSEWGLIWKINKEVLHPLGIAITRDPESGLSAGAIQTDEPWKYDAEVEARNEVRFNEFRQNLPF